MSAPVWLAGRAMSIHSTPITGMLRRRGCSAYQLAIRLERVTMVCYAKQRTKRWPDCYVPRGCPDGPGKLSDAPGCLAHLRAWKASASSRSPVRVA
jgi:hypothetical protein